MTFQNLKQLEKRYDKESKKCVKNAYNKKVDDLNPKHFNRCVGDITAGKLDQLNEVIKIIVKLQRYNDIQLKNSVGMKKDKSGYFINYYDLLNKLSGVK